MRKTLGLCALVSLVAFSASIQAQGAPAGVTTILIVRHAEKASEPAADPPLTAAGAARAELLAQLVADAGVRTVVSTQFVRSRSTATPTADRLGIPAEILDARLTPRATADSLLARHRGQTVLLVGHSNTVPAIIEALGAPRPPDICDSGYDNLFVVTIPTQGPAASTHLHFGASAPCAGSATMKP